MTKFLRLTISIAEAEGFELVEVEELRGSHAKLHMRYKGETFFLVTSNSKSSDVKAISAFTTICRGVRRAIDLNDPALRAKYLKAKR